MSPAIGRSRQHLLDFDADAIVVHMHDTAGDRHVVGEDADLVLLGRIEFDDRATAQPHDLMDGHRRGAEDHHEIDRNFIEGWHVRPHSQHHLGDLCRDMTTLWLAND